MLFRSINIAFRLLPTIILFLRDRKRWIIFGAPRIVPKEAHLERARRLRKNIASLGPTFIKLSQILSTRADLLPPAYIRELSKLQDRVPPHPAAVIKKIVAEELGCSVEEKFKSFDDEPLAAASLGQVHTATYKGEEVVLKVLRPRVREIVETDLRIVNTILAVLNAYFHHYVLTGLINIVTEYGKVIREEMDFLREAENTERFRENLAENEHIIIPKVYHDVCTSRVLVLKYYDGDKITDAEVLESRGIDPLPLLEKLIEVYAKMVLIDGFVHADPHPGNMLVISDSRVVLLDFGMVVRIDEISKDKFLRMAVAWAKRDIDTLVSCLYDIDAIDPEANVATVVDAAGALTEILDKYKFSQRRIQQYANEVLKTFYRFPIRMPSNLVYLVKTGVTLEGIGVMYDPTYDGAKAVGPVIKRMMGAVLKDPARSPLEYAIKKIEELRHLYNDALRTFHKVAREELHIRIHPADLTELEKFFSRMTRRTMAAIFALSISIVTAILHLSSGSTTLLVAGLGVALILFLVFYGLPTRPRK